MVSKQISVSNEWTRLRRNKAAVLLAAGVRQVQVAKLLGVQDREVRRWLADAEFAQQVRAIAAWQDHALEDTLTTEVAGTLFEMLSLWRAMIRGEVSSDDGRIALIAGPVTDYLARWASVEAEATSSPRAAGLQQQLNIYTNGGSPAA